MISDSYMVDCDCLIVVSFIGVFNLVLEWIVWCYGCDLVEVVVDIFVFEELCYWWVCFVLYEKMSELLCEVINLMVVNIEELFS